MLEHIELYHFKSHKHTSLELDDSRLHSLVGQNSVGKTSILQAVHYLSRLASSEFKSIFGYERDPSFLATVGEDEFSVTARGFWGYSPKRSWEASYQFTRTVKENKWLPSTSWKVNQTNQTAEGEEPGWDASLKNADEPVPQALRYAVFLKLIASNLAQPAYSEFVTPRVEYDGSGLAPTLDYLRSEAPEHFQNLQEMLKKIVPGVKKVDVRRAKVMVNRQRLIEVDGKSISYEESQEMAGQEVILNMATGERIPAHSISEGTMLTLGLLTVLMNPKQPNLVLLDDIEQGLHPTAQRELVAILKQIVGDNNNLQIIFSTHSPYIIDELEPSQVHVLSNINTDFTLAQRLDEHPDSEWAKHTLTTGEFWSAEGEEWVGKEAVDG